MMNPNVPSAKVGPTIVQLQAYASKFAILATVYSTIKKDRAGSENNNKKNLYYTLADSMSQLVAALKYLART